MVGYHIYMVTAQQSLQLLHTEIGKIRMRIQHIRHITRRITAPEVVAEVADPAELYRSLDSLNQLIEAYEEQLSDFELRVRSAVQIVSHRVDSIPGRERGCAAATADMIDNLAALGSLMTEFREDMSEDLAAAESILHLFTETERR